MKTSELNRLDPHGVRRSFERAAASYDAHAVLQRAVGDRLLETLELFTLQPRRILDLGAGTGYCADGLARRYPDAQLVLCDIAAAMLAQARQKHRRWFSRRVYACTDAQQNAIRDASVDLVFSNLTLQWCDLDRAFAECRRVLRTDGLLIFSSLGPDTLCELRAAFAEVDDEPHVNDFIDMHDVGDALIRAGFHSPVMQSDRLTLTYDRLRDVLSDLRGIGAVNQNSNRRRAMSARRTFEALQVAYEACRRDGVLPATYEVVYGHAFKPTQRARPQDGSTVASFPLRDLRRRS